MTTDAQTQEVEQKDAAVAVEAAQQPPVETPEQPKARRRTRSRGEPRKLSNPTIERELELKTLQAQRVYLRSMGYTSTALLNLSVIMHIVGNAEEANSTEAVVKTAIKNVEDELNKAYERSQILLKGLDDVCSPDYYSHTMQRTSYLQTPLAIRYLELIRKLDQLVFSIDTLWFSGAIESGARTHTIAEWQRRLLRLSNEILTIQRRAYNAAVNKGKKEELDKRSITSVDKEVSESEDDDQDEFDEVHTAEEATA